MHSPDPPSRPAFSGWTISTALYNTMGNAAAARGEDFFLHFLHAISDVDHSIATIPLIFLFYFFYDIAYTPMLVAYTLEILPYKVRAKGFATMVGSSLQIVDSQLRNVLVL